MLYVLISYLQVPILWHWVRWESCGSRPGRVVHDLSGAQGLSSEPGRQYSVPNAVL